MTLRSQKLFGALVALTLVAAIGSCGWIPTIRFATLTPANLDGFDAAAFPKGFFWGAASSAHQVEGNDIHSDWWPWEQAGRTKSGDVSGQATDHYNRFESDMDLLVDLNLDTYRFSLNWARIFPNGPDTPDDAVVARYDQFFAALKARHIRPMVTLLHFTSPQWVTDTDRWGTGEAIGDFTKFVRFVATRWGKDVDYWVTVNEPDVYSFHGWMRGIFPPGKLDPGLAFTVFTNFMKAHAEAYHLIKEIDTIDADGDGQPALVGIAQLIVPVEAFSAFNPVETAIANTAAAFSNGFWLRSNQTGLFDPQLPFVSGPFESYPRFKNTLDFIGVNYYSRQIVRFDLGGLFIGSPPGAVVSQLGIEIYPPGLQESLEFVSQFGLPILISENGIADAEDKDRAQYIVSHLSVLAEFIRRHPHVPVLGYIHWSLTDNYEWENGFAPRFGLYAVDYATQARTKRASADVFKQLITMVKSQP